MGWPRRGDLPVEEVLHGSSVTLAGAAAPPATLRFFLWTRLPGGLPLIPSRWLLFAVFKGENPVFGVEPYQTGEKSECE